MHLSARTANAFSLPFASLSEPLWPHGFEPVVRGEQLLLERVVPSIDEQEKEEARAYEDLLGLNVRAQIASAVLPSPLRTLPFWHHTGGSRKCIIYLEPRRNSPLYTAIEGFFRASAALLGPTEAHQYHPHCSMTGFIDIADNMVVPAAGVGSGGVQAPSGHVLTRIASHLHSLISRLHSERQRTPAGSVPTVRTVSTSHDYPHKGTHKVEVLLDTPPAFRHIIDGVTSAVPQAHIRPKRIGHISLAYYNKHVKTENLMSDEQAAQLDSLARSFLYGSDGVFDPERNLWDIAFYELAFKSPVLAAPHRFNEIARWQL
ncbi:hypothetical protein GQ54DRAFT_317016 [Martensiomyces pterosporus]|nr:hypothetical protein GQ54DRAFT_317016 [Martensiomyces pterosporus]